MSFPFSKPKVKDQLLSHGLQLEEFGGDVQAVEISALTVSDISDLHPVDTIRAEFENVTKILRLGVGFTRCNVIHYQSVNVTLNEIFPINFKGHWEEYF